ncbi:MAG: LamG domain-containing protein [Planctomycetes bacterium]|nr:LamG domain-containing protein [Planctomycetota bacterium]
MKKYHRSCAAKNVIVISILIIFCNLSAKTKAELVAHWRFDEANDLTAYDSSTNGNTAIINDSNGEPNWVNGKIGYALKFNGINDSAQAADVPNLNPLQLTIAAWIKLDTSPTAVGYDMWVVNKYSDSTDTGYALLVDTYYSEDRVGFYIADSNSTTRLRSNSDIAIDTWYHIAATYDGSTMKVYINGEEDNSASHITGISTFNEHLFIGGSNTDSLYFDGIIDEVRIYDSNMTQEQIAGLMAPEPICGDFGHPYPLGDFDNNCRVNMLDFAFFADNWLKCTAPQCD